jgi:hypothetical protein
MANNSAVARLMAQIAAEYEAGVQALHGPALGNARHDFIIARMEGIENARVALIKQVGEEATLPLIIEAIEGKKPSS